MPKPLRVGIVVGEQSGDILGADLMRSLSSLSPNIEFIGIGGKRMVEAGCHSLYDQERLAVMGFVEPLKRLPELLSIRKSLFNYFSEQPPDVFIGIDAPDFNLDLELKLRQRGIKTVHYVSPSVWAWRQGRVKKIAKAVDLMLTLFPFEADFYRSHQVPVKFVGHPLADQLTPDVDIQKLRTELELDIDNPVLALLPGSREGEVRLIGPTFWQTAELCRKEIPTLQFIIPAASSARAEQIKSQLQMFPELPVKLLLHDSQKVMSAADAVLMASGTTTLEALLLGKPMVVAYKLAWLSYAILSRLVKSDFISLPNLLANRALVPELIQKEATPGAISTAILPLLERNDSSLATLAEFEKIRSSIKLNAGEQAATAVMELIHRV